MKECNLQCLQSSEVVKHALLQDGKQIVVQNQDTQGCLGPQEPRGDLLNLVIGEVPADHWEFLYTSSFCKELCYKEKCLKLF